MTFTKEEKKLHALVIGGTGMLKRVSMWLCEQEFHVSIIGRDEVKLENVKRECYTRKYYMPSVRVS